LQQSIEVVVQGRLSEIRTETGSAGHVDYADRPE